MAGTVVGVFPNHRAAEQAAEALLEDGVYRNQFETGLSSGSLSAFAGGVS